MHVTPLHVTPRRGLLKGRLGGGISLMMTGTGSLRAHAQAREIVVAALRGDVLPPRFLGDPARHGWSRPASTVRRRSLQCRGQLLLLFGAQ
jgi:hypothetical protein